MSAPRRVAMVEREVARRFFDMDRTTLADLGEVTVLRYDGRPTLRFVRDAWRAARRCEALYVFFASEHALIPALFFRAHRRRVVIATGGYDTADEPAHGYGLASDRRRWVPRLAIRLSTRLLPFSGAAERELVALAPRARAKVRLIPLAVDADIWTDPGVQRRETQVVTCAATDEVSWSRKGIDRFVAAARQMPDVSFVLVGSMTAAVTAQLQRDGIPENLVLTGRLDQAAMVRTLWSSSVYCQLSWHEGFGLAMAEAMVCGCRPAITAIGALPEVASQWATTSDGPEDDVRAITDALHRTSDRDAMAGDIVTRFDPRRRQASLLAVMSGRA